MRFGKGFLLYSILQTLRSKPTSFPLLSTKGAWKDNYLMYKYLPCSKKNFLSPFIHRVLDP